MHIESHARCCGTSQGEEVSIHQHHRFKDHCFHHKQCAAIYDYTPGNNIATEAELQYTIVDPILNGVVELFESESIILCS